MDAGPAAEVARRRIKRASGLLREATRDLSQLIDGGPDVLAALVVHDSATSSEIADLIALGVAQHGAVEVIVVPRPQRHSSTPTTAADAAKEAARNGTENDTAARR